MTELINGILPYKSVKAVRVEKQFSVSSVFALKCFNPRLHSTRFTSNR